MPTVLRDHTYLPRLVHECTNRDQMFLSLCQHLCNTRFEILHNLTLVVRAHAVRNDKDADFLWQSETRSSLSCLNNLYTVWHWLMVCCSALKFDGHSVSFCLWILPSSWIFLKTRTYGSQQPCPFVFISRIHILGVQSLYSNTGLNIEKGVISVKWWIVMASTCSP